MKLSRRILPFTLLALLTLAARSAHAQDAVVNGSFESGFAPGWTNVDASGFSGVGTDSAFSASGSNYVFLGANPNPGTLSQTLVTVPGAFYTLAFSLANDSGVPPNFFQVLFDGNVILTLNDAASFGYTVLSFPDLQATTSATPLEFRYMHDDDFFRLDAVSATVPEPTSIALAVLGLLLLRRRKPTGHVSIA